MRFKTLWAATAAAGLAISSVAAQAAPQPLPARDGSEISQADELAGGGWFVPLIAIVAIVLGILAATGGDDDIPTSP
jgi:hypothetical protein